MAELINTRGDSLLSPPERGLGYGQTGLGLGWIRLSQLLVWGLGLRFTVLNGRACLQECLQLNHGLSK